VLRRRCDLRLFAALSGSPKDNTAGADFIDDRAQHECLPSWLMLLASFDISASLPMSLQAGYRFAYDSNKIIFFQ